MSVVVSAPSPKSLESPSEWLPLQLQLIASSAVGNGIGWEGTLKLLVWTIQDSPERVKAAPHQGWWKTHLWSVEKRNGSVKMSTHKFSREAFPPIQNSVLIQVSILSKSHLCWDHGQGKGKSVNLFPVRIKYHCGQLPLNLSSFRRKNLNYCLFWQ